MPLVWILFSAFIGTYIAKIVFRVFIALGIGIVVYTGGSILIDNLSTTMAGHFGGLPTDIIAILGILKLDIAVTMILSAYVAKFALSGFKWIKK